MATAHLRIPVRSRSHILLIDPAEIDCIAACGNYVRLHRAKDKYLIRGTISAFEQRLGPHGFVRVHRSTLVNIEHVVSLAPANSGDYVIQLASGRTATLSRTYRDPFFQFVNARAR